ncbi:hypothetical protein PLESTF_001877100 [Pleodorina starrii]|nr:hypothetical protein PLESTF_001877100 [Pleodorina starrii]
MEARPPTDEEIARMNEYFQLQPDEDVYIQEVAPEDREREERTRGGSRGGDGAAAAGRRRSLDAWVEGEGEADRDGAAKADSDDTAKTTRRRERRWITSAAPAACGATRRTEVVAKPGRRS